MLYTAIPQKEKESLSNQTKSTIFRRPEVGVRQDSIATSAMRASANQPASEEKLSRPRQRRDKKARTQKGNVSEKPTVPTTIHMPPIVRQRLMARAAGAKDPKLASISGMANAMILRGLACEPDKPYGPSLEPVIQGSINKGFLRHDNRLASLQARDTYNSTQAVHLLTNALNLILAIFEKQGERVSPNTFKKIVEESERKAIEALTIRDPRFLEMVRDTHLTPGGREEDA
jgi:hypothetical protein